MRAPAPGRTGLLLVLLVALAVHAPAIGGGWVYDDWRFVVDNDALSPIGNPLRFLDPATADPHRATDVWRPIRTLDFAISRAAFGLDSGPWHLASVLIHAVNAALLFALLGRLGASVLGATAGAALFAAHPAQVEAVAWISSRGDLWSACFVLLAVHAWIRSAGWDRWAVMAAGLGLLACMSKESAVVFPAFLLVADLVRRGGVPGELSGSRWEPDPGGLAALRGRLGPWAMSAVVAVAFGLLARGMIESSTGTVGHLREWWGGSYGSNLATAARAAAFQALFAVVPVVPSIDRFLEPSTRLLDAGAAAAALFVLGLLAVSLRALLRGGADARRAGGGIAAAFAAGLLTSHLLVVVGIPTAERFLYLPIAFGAAAVAVLVERAAAVHRSGAIGCAALAVAALGAVSVERAAVWRSHEALWTLGPAGGFSPRAEYWHIEGRNQAADLLLATGTVLAEAGRPDAAREYRERARDAFAAITREAGAVNAFWRRVAGVPDGEFEARFRRNLALARLRTGDPAGALADAAVAESLQPGHARSLRFRAEAYEALGRIQRAGWSIERALAAEKPDKPGDLVPRGIGARILNAAAEWRVSRGYDGAAVRALEASARLVPDGTRNSAVERLPHLRAQAEKRLADLEAEASRRPQDFGARAAAVIYAGRGSGSPARGRAAFLRAFGGAPDSASMRTLRALAEFESADTEHDWAAAEAVHRATLESWPLNPGALLGIARCREAREDLPGAARAWRAVLADPVSPPEAHREAREGLARVGQ